MLRHRTFRVGVLGVVFVVVAGLSLLGMPWAEVSAVPETAPVAQSVGEIGSSPEAAAGVTTTTEAPATTTTTTTLPPPPAPPPPPSPTTTTTTVPPPPPSLAPGDSGKKVAELQTYLADYGFYHSEIDGEYGDHTAAAVIAVHKALDFAREDVWTAEDWDALAAYPGPDLPYRADEPSRVEVDVGRQLLFLIEEQDVIATIPVSTANGAAYVSWDGRTVTAATPHGDFSFFRRIDGWRYNYLGALYKPWYFSGPYAVHGLKSVPPYPASHGCVRVHFWDADYLSEYFYMGLPIHVWDDVPEGDPQPVEPRAPEELPDNWS